MYKHLRCLSLSKTFCIPYILICIFSFALDIQSAGATTLSQNVVDVIDTNPAPNILEAELTVDEQDVNIGGTRVHALIYKDVNNPSTYTGIPNGIPIPQIVVNVGDQVVVKLNNELDDPCSAIACDTSIHWHGIELDADSDGTGVTQNSLVTGETYTYRFFTHRPGIFWFHPHMRPGPQVFAGAYGAFIVKDPNEETLQNDAKIPSAANTHTVVLSDIEFDDEGDVGYLDNSGGVINAVPWATLHHECSMGNTPSCQTIVDGRTVLVNGQKPTADAPVITTKSGAGIRLRLINSSTNRYFRLSVEGNGTDNNLYRIGGEGGFLEQVRLEGGTLGSWDTKYDRGEVVLGSSARADVVIVPTGNDGDVIKITGKEYARGGPAQGIFPKPAGDLLYIVIDNSIEDTPFNIAEGNDILGAGSIENIKALAITDIYQDPIPVIQGNPGSGAGSSDEIIRLDNLGLGMGGMLSIDGVVGHFEDSGGDYTQVPFQDATRYALTGDVLELTVKNDTMLHHPFHHHGFSFQPVRVIDDSTNTTLYEFDYNEFIDVIDVFNGQSVVIRMRLEDRPRITDNRQEAGAPAPNQFFTSGGAAGRWVFHCHLFLHAAIGMIAELVVLDTDRDLDGFDTSEDCDDFNPNINPDAEEVCDDLDNNCNGIVDEDTTSPEIVVSADPIVLWPPNHEYTTVLATQNVISVSDNCSDLTTDDIIISSISSDEPENAIGDGNTVNDIVIAEDCKSADLRREQQSTGNGRVYTVNFEASDDQGNIGSASIIVTVPLSIIGNPAIDDGPAYTVDGLCGN